MKNKNRGFTLVELLATIIILAIVMGVTLVTINGGFKKAKRNTQEVFVKTLSDALNVYISDTSAIKDAGGNSLTFTKCGTFDKTHKFGVEMYRANTNITFLDVIGSGYTPLDISDIVNPANKEVACTPGAANVTIYHDSDYVYYYKVAESEFGCLLDADGKYISNLPSNLPNGC